MGAEILFADTALAKRHLRFYLHYDLNMSVDCAWWFYENGMLDTGESGGYRWVGLKGEYSLAKPSC